MSVRRGVSAFVAVAMLLSLGVLLSACDFGDANKPTEPPRTVFAEPPTLALPPTEPTQPLTLPKFTEPTATIPTLPPATTPAPSTAPKPPSTTPPSASIGESTTKPPEVPSNLRTISGIVEYFNKAANDAKANANKATQTLDRIKVIESSAAGVDMTGPIGLARNVDSSKEKTITKSNLPVRGKSYASRLQPAGVADASCKIDGGEYVVTISLKPESGRIYQDNSYHGQVFTITDGEGENDDLPGATKKAEFKISYSNASIVSRINRKTGRLNTSHYAFHQRIEGTIGTFAWVTYEIDVEDAYAFTWN